VIELTKTLEKVVEALRTIMVGARTLEPMTFETAKARLALIGQVAEEAIQEAEEHEATS
jgi:hypothetical protein